MVLGSEAKREYEMDADTVVFVVIFGIIAAIAAWYQFGGGKEWLLRPIPPKDPSKKTLIMVGDKHYETGGPNN